MSSDVNNTFYQDEDQKLQDQEHTSQDQEQDQTSK